ncbi:MAG TPA: amidase family protein [Candidatus Binataceae bacterium]|nr:amidase family protein [Candidatus Binataceae bacterium]
MDAVTLAAHIRAKRLSAVEVVEAVLARMERLEPHLHAFCTPTPDLARVQARRVEADIMAGRPVGALAGVPVGHKDLLLTRGVRTASGSYAYRDFVPDEDDLVVERMRAAGAVMLGKTNVPEFGYSPTGHNPVFETTRNPWNTALTPGGSSAGSGAAVAAGVGPIATGSDGGGSVRIPASFCGLYGLKPSMGRIPLYPGARDERYPGVSGWESVEHIGPLSRTVADAALMMSVAAGPDMRDRHSLPRADFDWMECMRGDLRGVRVAYSADWGYAAVDPEVRRIVGNAVRVFERDLGCVVEEANPGWEDPFPAFFAIIMAESDLRGMRELAAKYPGRMSGHLADWLAIPWTAEDFTNANMARKAVVRKMASLMARYELLLTPTLAVPPFPIHMQGPEKIDGRYVRPAEFLAFTFPMNLTGQPAATVPAGWTADGLPVGLQIVGRHLDDPMVLRASAAFEAASPWRDKWPPLLAELGL